ncbi:hypothetical protein [Alkalihalobacillus sp. 1P02AB]|uniref:hypothetical protein n=1 Tax=Alkalihalobacillus sp. 1P02AB TaxID=3132260 RepID=UPI0039A500AD
MRFRKVGKEMMEIEEKDLLASPGLAIYTVREAFSQDYYTTLKKVAEIGYRTLDLYEYEHIPPNEMKRTLDSL